MVSGDSVECLSVFMVGLMASRVCVCVSFGVRIAHHGYLLSRATRFAFFSFPLRSVTPRSARVAPSRQICAAGKTKAENKDAPLSFSLSCATVNLL